MDSREPDVLQQPTASSDRVKEPVEAEEAESPELHPPRDTADPSEDMGEGGEESGEESGVPELLPITECGEEPESAVVRACSSVTPKPPSVLPFYKSSATPAELTRASEEICHLASIKGLPNRVLAFFQKEPVFTCRKPGHAPGNLRQDCHECQGYLVWREVYNMGALQPFGMSDDSDSVCLEMIQLVDQSSEVTQFVDPTEGLCVGPAGVLQEHQLRAWTLGTRDGAEEKILRSRPAQRLLQLGLTKEDLQPEWANKAWILCHAETREEYFEIWKPIDVLGLRIPLHKSSVLVDSEEDGRDVKKTLTRPYPSKHTLKPPRHPIDDSSSLGHASGDTLRPDSAAGTGTLGQPATPRDWRRFQERCAEPFACFHDLCLRNTFIDGPPYSEVPLARPRASSLPEALGSGSL